MIGRKTISEEVLDYFKQWLSLTQSIPTAHQLAERFGISIEISDKSPKRGNLILRSEYSGNPPTIILYRSSVDIWLGQLQMKFPKLKITSIELLEICTFHEICHHLLVYPACFFPQSFSKDLKCIKRAEEEKIVQNLLGVWLISRFPDYNTHIEQILES